MNTLRDYHWLRAVLLVLVVSSWGLGPAPAQGYAPIDDLINTISQLTQTGQISDVKVASNLIVSLQSIGTLIDGGQKPAAKNLLVAFRDEVSNLSGVGMTASAASQLADEAQTISAGL